MRGRKTSLRVVLTPLERAELEQRLRFMNTSLGLARRCRADPRRRRRAAPGRGRAAGRLDGEARAEVGPAVPEGSPGRGCAIVPDAAASRSFPPEVAMHVVKIACERPDDVGRSLSQWDCIEIARQLVRDGVVPSISAETVRQILLHHRLKPWRQKMWLSAKVPATRPSPLRSRRSATCTPGRCGRTRSSCASTR